MKLYGDVPQEYRDVAAELKRVELNLDSDFTMKRDQVAKAYVCLAHDWYQMACEEEGVKLLAKAESIYPGYFKTMIAKHCYTDPDFEYLVRSITAQLVNILTSTLKDDKQ